MRWWLVGVWLLAAVMCGVVLWLDAYFTTWESGESQFPFARAPGRLVGTRYSSLTSFGWRGSTTSLIVYPSDLATEGLDTRWTETYAEWLAENRAEPEAEVTERVPLRLLRAGAALLAATCAAPLLGLLAVAWRGAAPTLRHVLLLLAAFLPLAALEYFGHAVGAAATDSVSTSATPATWAARVAWAGLAAATAASWWCGPRARRATPVDPGVFE